MTFLALLTLSVVPLLQAQYVPPPAPVLLTSTKSGVLPVLPTPFNGVETLEGAIINKAPVNESYLPVNGPASVQSNLPSATYTATLPSIAFDALTGTTINGTVTASSNQGDTGTTFSFALTNFPDLAQYGPFVYHIHDMPVPADGNCTSTMGHFDPTNSGEYYTCPLDNPQNCQVGDLAGKHGMINDTSFTATFIDAYLSTDPASPYFFGARSFVIHTSNTTRLTCANFVQAAAGAGGNATGTSTAPPVATYTGGAGRVVLGGATAGVALVLGMLLY